jgi:predicted metal-dependent phosphoesterase TrpH
LSARDLVQRVHDEGGVAVAAHPYRRGFGLEDRIYKLDLDGIEVLNGNCTPEEMQQAKEVQEKLQLAATGGSDAHRVDTVGNYLTWFPEPVTTEAQLVAAIKQKRCRPAYGEELLLNG